MSERAPYSRVYWAIVDDPKFALVYDDDRHLATWLRLLLIADQAWPASAHLPANARRVSVDALEECGLVIRSGHRYRISGLDNERERRKVSATSRGPRGDQTGTTREPNGFGTQALAEPSLAEPRKAEPNARDIVDDYYRLTNRFPTGTVKEWLDRLANEFGYESASRQLATQYRADQSLRSLLGRVENELKSARHIASKKQAAAEKARLEEWARTHKLTPEQAADNQRRIKDLMRDWLEPGEAA